MNTMDLLAVCVWNIIAVAFGVLLFRSRKGAGSKKNFDERQQRVRGLGYRCGFFAFLILDALVAVLVSVFDIVAANMLIVMYAVIFISVSVYAAYCIVNDAYIGLNENPKRTMGILTAAALINAAAALPALLHGIPFISNGEIASWVANLFFAVILFALDGVYCFHQRKLAKDED